jgi:hypothetical protein
MNILIATSILIAGIPATPSAQTELPEDYIYQVHELGENLLITGIPATLSAQTELPEDYIYQVHELGENLLIAGIPAPLPAQTELPEDSLTQNMDYIYQVHELGENLGQAAGPIFPKRNLRDSHVPVALDGQDSGVGKEERVLFGSEPAIFCIAIVIVISLVIHGTKQRHPKAEETTPTTK